MITVAVKFFVFNSLFAVALESLNIDFKKKGDIFLVLNPLFLSN